jgi:hypothetical protein
MPAASRVAGRKPIHAAQCVDIGVRPQHVARLHREESDHRLAIEGPFDLGDEVHHRLRMLVSDVEQSVRLVGGRRVRSTHELHVGRRRLVENGGDAGHDVTDISEIALQFAVVEDFDGAALENCARKKEVGHIRPAPRAIDREEAQSRRGQAVEMAVAVCHQLVGLLGCGLEAHGMVDALPIVKWRNLLAVVHAWALLA